ncbi:PTS sugar transporter subunit IIC [Irregularibacter muris]|uniref:PTS sugar transporter subunit IIC n=1 Tax=Irregularibacter muris TaxID=1796619 RepID=A0AAE3HFD6_9FIRM|nr:PTS sugar transporter subunit IIC [Irregularibacter muris]MCR1899111.1 PTS sugar transporter subunit IIC [Irregularibacter muris]
MSIIQAILLGVIYWISQNKVWYGFSNMRMPICLAPIIGLIFGDMETALVTGATLQMIYIGSIASGGNHPADEGIAACIAIPMAIQAGISPEVAVSIAVPVGLLGTFIDNIRKTINTGFVHLADKYADEGNAKGVRRAAFLYPLLVSFPLRFLPVFFASIYGPAAVQTFMDAVPGWVTHGLTIAGGILPALGFALTMITIGKTKYIPFFIIGFFIVAYSGLSIIGVSIFGLCIAYLYMTSNKAANKSQAEGGNL